MAKHTLTLKLGDNVLMERDEKLYPSKGSWLHYRNQLGTVVQLNHSDGEVGISFGTVRQDSEGHYQYSKCVWFLGSECRVLEAS